MVNARSHKVSDETARSLVREIDLLEARFATSDETGSRSARCEQLGGFYRAKEEFNGDDAVLSYLNSEGENNETYDNSISHCVRALRYGRLRKHSSS